MPLFRNNSEREVAKTVIYALKAAGAERIGITGSKVSGAVDKDDIDIVVTWPEGHRFETQQLANKERMLPDGTVIPSPFDIITINRNDQGEKDPVGTSARRKARWIR